MSDQTPTEIHGTSEVPPGGPEEAGDLHGPPSAILSWSKCGAELASRRSQALADYWAGMAGARQPDQAMAVQMDYWSHWIDDYTAAAVEALAPFAPPAAGQRPH